MRVQWAGNEASIVGGRLYAPMEVYDVPDDVATQWVAAGIATALSPGEIPEGTHFVSPTITQADD